MFNSGQNIAYAPESRCCHKCGKEFMTNYYGHETLCPKCKSRLEKIKFLKSPIKGIIKKIIKYADS